MPCSQYAAAKVLPHYRRPAAYSTRHKNNTITCNPDMLHSRNRKNPRPSEKMHSNSTRPARPTSKRRWISRSKLLKSGTVSTGCWFECRSINGGNSRPSTVTMVRRLQNGARRWTASKVGSMRWREARSPPGGSYSLPESRSRRLRRLL